jgi:hypothetical protein
MDPDMGKKKKAAAEAAPLSKKERKALEAREAELAAELAAREAKKAKKGKKAKAETAPPTKAERDAKSPTKLKGKKLATANAETLLGVTKRSAKAKVTAAADKALATPSSPGAREAAQTAAEAAAEASPDETDEQIKARVLAKRAARAAAAQTQAAIPGPVTEKSAAHKALDALAGDVPVEPQVEALAKAKIAVGAAKAAIADVVEVETERGRVFEAGTADEPTVVMTYDMELDGVKVGDYVDNARVISGEVLNIPGSNYADDIVTNASEGPRRWEDDTNGLGQYKVARPADGKVVGYTRATTYINCLEDRSRLEAWKLRILLEGVAINDHPDEEGRMPDPVVAEVRDLIHRRDVAIAKARKADRKGKLVSGQLGTVIDGAWSEFKRSLDAIAERLLDLGGAHEKAQKGTDLHALMELADREGITAVGDLLTEGKITPADLVDVEAYLAAIEKIGAKILPEHIEQVVINDELKVGGRLDRVAMVRLPGEQRARRRVVDIKTGQIKPGILAQQLEMYSSSQGYDPDTHERTDLKLDRTKALVVHVPAGTGEAHVYVVDLTIGRKGNRLAGEVRAFRNEGKRAVDLKADITKVEVA